jgi:acetolactate synthase-1/2/3 large subunit
MMNRCEKPILLCGHGVINSNVGQRLRRFAEKANIPVAFTLHGLSAMPVDHPLSTGMVGMHGTVEANRALLNADLIISMGMRFDDRVTGNLATFALDAEVIHVEIDPSEIDKNVATSVAINADAAEALKLLENDPGLISKPRRHWFDQIDTWRGEIAGAIEAEVAAGVGQKGQLLMKTITRKLSDITEGRDIIVSDVGQHQMILARFYNFQTTNSWFTSGGAGTMGCALPMAVGVKLVRPDERVWSISGDGGFQMNIQELGAVMEHAIDIKILLFNNGYLGMVRQWQTLFYDGRFAGTPMQNPDFGLIAKAYGIPTRAFPRSRKSNRPCRPPQTEKGPAWSSSSATPAKSYCPWCRPAAESPT